MSLLVGRQCRVAPEQAQPDYSHPLMPASGWVPSMGMRSLHNDPIIREASNDGFRGHTSLGEANQHPTDSSQRMGWANHVRGSRTEITLMTWGSFLTATGGSACLATRSHGVNNISLFAGGGLHWCCTFNDLGWDYESGVVITGEQMVVAVVRATTIEFWINGVKMATNTGLSLPAVDFDSLVGQDAWQTGDRLSSFWTMGGPCSLYYIYDRALLQPEIVSLWADPFQYLVF